MSKELNYLKKYSTKELSEYKKNVENENWDRTNITRKNKYFRVCEELENRYKQQKRIQKSP